VDLVLVHGLTGNSVATWTNDADSFWPAWLSKDYEYVNVWTADYPAPLTRLATKGSRFDIRSSAKALVDYCATTSLGSRNTVWVAHSLGGLVLKQLLYVSKDLQASRYKRFWDTTGEGTTQGCACGYDDHCERGRSRPGHKGLRMHTCSS